MSPSSPGFGGRRRARDRAATPEPQGLGTVLDDLLGTGVWGSGVRLGRLARSWDAVVGSRLARESAPVRLGNGVLVVRASSAAWAAQLRFLAREVAEQVNRVLAGEPVREVKVVVDRASDP